MSQLRDSLLLEWYYESGGPPAETAGFQLFHWIKENLVMEDQATDEPETGNG